MVTVEKNYKHKPKAIKPHKSSTGTPTPDDTDKADAAPDTTDQDIVDKDIVSESL